MIKKYAIYYSFLYLIIICVIFRCSMPKNNIRDKKEPCKTTVSFVSFVSHSSNYAVTIALNTTVRLFPIL